MALLKRFHSVYGIARATEDEIAAVAGIGATLAAAVRKAAASAAGEKA
jgi:excinuclease UvrABC nuclease subunit